MYKATMDLCRITKNLRLRFGLILKGDDPKETPIVMNFEKGGNRYMTITPHPFITVDIYNKKNGPWNSNQSFTLSGMSKYLFTKRLRELRMESIEDKELFFMYNGRLCLNNERATNHRKLVPVGSGKTVMLIPVVILEEETNEQYEGISIMINSPENYSNITYEEAEFLIDYLERVDLENLTLNFINLVVLRSGQKSTTSNLNSIFQGVKVTAQKIDELKKGENDGIKEDSKTTDEQNVSLKPDR